MVFGFCKAYGEVPASDRYVSLTDNVTTEVDCRPKRP